MFTHPLITYYLATAHMEELRREAARHNSVAAARNAKERHTRAFRLHLPHRRGSARIVHAR
jgi:hypothetical protein